MQLQARFIALQSLCQFFLYRELLTSGVVLETRVLVSRRLEDRNGGLGLGLETWSLGLGLNC